MASVAFRYCSCLPRIIVGVYSGIAYKTRRLRASPAAAPGRGIFPRGTIIVVRTVFFGVLHVLIVRALFLFLFVRHRYWIKNTEPEAALRLFDKKQIHTPLYISLSLSLSLFEGK